MPGFSHPDVCGSPGCTAGPDETRAYLVGHRCPEHTPARMRGIPEPLTSPSRHVPLPPRTDAPPPDDAGRAGYGRPRGSAGANRAIDRPSAHPGRQVTSSEAARKALPKTGTQRREILDALVAAHASGHVGATDPELERRLGIGPNSVRPRRGELVTAGLVYDSGRTRDHLGNAHIVWAPSSGALAACGHHPA